MAPLAAPDRLKAYRDALSNWETANYIQFTLNETGHRFIRAQLEGICLPDIKRRMYEHVLIEGAEIDEQPETRVPWSSEFRFHHDLRLIIQGKPLYIETRLHYWLPVVLDDSWIEVVNIHAP